MKRCPQCEFIYEDDQRLCDMDGTHLVFDLRALPGGLVTQKTGSADSGSSRSLVFPLVGVVLGVVLLAVGYASIEWAVSPKSDPAPLTAVADNQPSPPQPISPQPAAAEISFETFTENVGVAESESSELAESPVGQPRADAVLPAMMTREDLVTTSKPSAITKNAPKPSIPELPGIRPLPRLKPLPRLPEPKTANPARATTIQKSVGASQKKDSRFGSLLKKTGRILTKPFKF